MERAQASRERGGMARTRQLGFFLEAVAVGLLSLQDCAHAFAPLGTSGASLTRCTTATSTATARSFIFPSKSFPASSSSSSLSFMQGSGVDAGIELSGLFYDSASTAFDAWEWTANLGAPAALVAGAVLVTLSETRQEMAPRRSDSRRVRIAKQMTRFLLLSSFACEVVSIFVSTMTGSVLLAHGEAKAAAKATAALARCATPLGLLHHHHEFEYLTIQLGFLQGLLHWLAAAALEVTVPKEGETLSARRMNAFMASSLVTIIFWILAFYNHHLSFYADYAQMVKRYAILFVQRYFWCRFRPMSLLYGPAFVVSTVLGIRAFRSKRDLDDDGD